MQRWSSIGLCRGGARAARLFMAAGLLSACGDQGPAPEPHDPGLIPLAQVQQPTGGPHLAEFAVYDGRWLYVANSNDVFAVYELVGDDGLALVLERVEGVGEVRCTTLAVHSPSASLYCGNDEYPWVYRYSLADPRVPVRVGEPWPQELPGPAHRDLEVIGDRLYFARYDYGLASAAIAEDGGLGPTIEPAGIAGNVRFLAGGGEGLLAGGGEGGLPGGEGARLWALTADRGLLLLGLEPDGAVVELAALALAGPALDLGLDEDTIGQDEERAIVALGSQGAAVVRRRGDDLELVATMHPPGVVSAADLHGDAAAVVTLTGAYLYDLREDAATRVPDRPGGGWADGEPPIAGFMGAGSWIHIERSGSLLYGRFHGDTLLTTDWNYVERMGVNLDGYPRGVDIQRAAYHNADEAEVGFGLRNPGALPQEVDVLAVRGDRLERLTLQPFESRVVRIDAARFEIGVPELVLIHVRDGGRTIADLSTVVLRRPPASAWPVLERGVPAPGDRFPTLTVGRGPIGFIEPVTVPSAGVAQRVVFFGSDCAAMWPEIDDLIWRLRAGDLQGGGAFLESFDNLTPLKSTRWMIDDLPWGFSSPDELPPEIVALNPWMRPYDEGLSLHELPGAAYHPTDYELDAEGRVIAVEREYRGTHPLFAAALDGAGDEP